MAMIEKFNEQTKNQDSKYHKDVQFEPRDLVQIHLRKAIFPNKRSYKFLPQLDGIFEILEKVDPNAYKVDFLSKYSVSPIFNVLDLRPYFDEEVDVLSLRANSFQAKGVDRDQAPVLHMPEEVQKVCEEVNEVQEILNSLHRVRLRRYPFFQPRLSNI